MDSSSYLVAYRNDRYLREASDDALIARLADIGTNLWSTDRDGNVSPTRDQAHRAVLLKLYVDTLLEQHLRNSGEIVFDEAKLRAEISKDFMKPRTKRPINFMPTCLSKFGRKDRILDAYERGVIRIAPAQSYSDSSLNYAQRDDELSHHVQSASEQLKFKIFGGDGDRKQTELNFHPKELFRYKNVQNFYVWCCALGYDSRLFSEFKSDAALILTDIDAFESRLARAVRDKLPNAAFEKGAVNYYDPYTSKYSQLSPGFIKHIRFLYQNEYRFVWRSDSTEGLEAFFVELGSLRDIATVVELV